MMLTGLKAGLVSFFSAFLASLCCLLPLAVVLLGLGSGAFMAVTMQYRPILLPVGVIGVGLGYFFYFRQRGRCETVGCAFVRRKANLALLLFATLMLAAELALVIFPEVLSNYLQGVM